MRLSPDLTDRITDILEEFSGFRLPDPQSVPRPDRQPGLLTVLDIGCGDGSLLASLPEEKFRLIGTDVKEGCFPDRRNFEFVPGRAEELPLADQTADIVILQCVFSLCEPEKAAAEAGRVARQGGLLILADLYTELETASVGSSELLGKIYHKNELETFFEKDFTIESFMNETGRLTQLLLQAVMDGEACASADDLKLLRQIRAQYGLWTLRRA